MKIITLKSEDYDTPFDLIKHVQKKAMEALENDDIDEALTWFVASTEVVDKICKDFDKHVERKKKKNRH
ncbi:hypothetical protein [Endozoicomonas ascidiicola]|uniref:hypothetical protein n=1 Tax=Endozoicomonas ascidiicola TaxID=1698521 RepID=UPI00082E1293|nr:hypothetical protein [Endozoicomonas ascidiicola]